MKRKREGGAQRGWYQILLYTLFVDEIEIVLFIKNVPYNSQNKRPMPCPVFPYIPTVRVCVCVGACMCGRVVMPVINVSFSHPPSPLYWSRFNSGANGAKWLLTGPLRPAQ